MLLLLPDDDNLNLIPSCKTCRRSVVEVLLDHDQPAHRAFDLRAERLRPVP
jgi:hypothetical protein